jgi:transcriptional regulator with XRE-family HTH domain
MPKKPERPTGFAGKLKELRESAGLTQQQLAERAGFHGFTVAKLEQGVQEPTWPTVLDLAGALGVSVSAFVAESRSPPAPKRGPGRPRKDRGGLGLPTAPPAPPPAGDLEGQAEAGPAATRGRAPKRPRARPPRGK